MLFHITTTADWTPDHAWYAPADFVAGGFVHCSTSDQVARVANHLFEGRHDLLLLCIDPNCVSAPIRYENLKGGVEMFPHIYGPIEISAIVSVVPLVPTENGRIALPDIALTSPNKSPARSLER